MLTNCLHGHGYSNEPVYDSIDVCKLLSAVFAIFPKQFAMHSRSSKRRKEECSDQESFKPV